MSARPMTMKITPEGPPRGSTLTLLTRIPVGQSPWGVAIVPR